MAISADLGEVLEKVVNDLAENGRYNSKSEVLREARHKALAKLLQEGEEDIAAGRVHPAEGVFEELLARYEAMANRSSR